MPPKRAAARSALPPPPLSPPCPPWSSSSAPVEEKVGKNKSDAATLRKPTSHPPTIVMVREALKVLDSRKGATSQAILKYIKAQYPTADGVRLKHFVRRALIKGMENGTLVRPPNATITSGALGRFRLPPKMGSKPKSENTDPNVPTAPKAAKDEVKRPQKEGGAKKGSAASGEVKPAEVKPAEVKPAEVKPAEDLMPPRKAKKDEKPAPVKKPKAKKAEANGSEGNSHTTRAKATDSTRAKATDSTRAKATDSTTAKATDSTRAKATDSTKATKTTTRPKTAKASQGKAVKAGGDAHVVKSAKQKTK